jgi:aspartyl-tRNA(Asn)/glutamyl-tRNA(Gln) amidotransferase subunit A
VKSYDSLSAVQSDLENGALTCGALLESYVERIRETEALNLFLEVWAEEARARAAALDAARAEGNSGRLDGMVLGIKDMIAYEGHEMTAGSRMLSGFRSLFSATAVERLLAEGAILVGRQNCDEFAMGSSNETSAYGPARNPLDPSRTPGGSSGASAAAVAAGCCLASLGSDTGGSVRQPAAFTGVVGLKPSYGRISRWGLVAYASSFDQIGPIARRVEDAALLLQVMAGPDGKDQSASRRPVPDYLAGIRQSVGRRFRIAYLREALESPGLDPELRRITGEQIARLRAAGHELEAVSFPLLPYLAPCYYILTTAEASSNLARYDGVRYGYRSPSAETLEQLYTRSRSEGFGREVKRRILLGSFVLSAGYFEAYYRKAMQVRRRIQQDSAALFQRYDLLLSPTAPEPPFRLGEKSEDPVSMYLSDIFTVHANLAGIPAISLPAGSTGHGLPAGLQLMAGAFEEGKLLAAAWQVQQMGEISPAG